MPQNLRGSLLQPTRLFIRARLPDRSPEGLREARDDGDIVLGEVVQLDRLGDAVVLLRVLGRAGEDFLVVLVGVGELEEGRALLDDAGLELEVNMRNGENDE